MLKTHQNFLLSCCANAWQSNKYFLHILSKVKFKGFTLLFTPNIKANTFTFIYFTLFGTHTRIYGSSIALQLPPHLSILTVNGSKRVSLEFISTSVGLIWDGQLFRYTF